MQKKGASDSHHIVLLAIVGVVALVGLVLAFSNGVRPSAQTGGTGVTGAAVTSGGSTFGQTLNEQCTNTRSGRTMTVNRCGQYFGMQSTGLISNCGPHSNQQVANYCNSGCGINNEIDFDRSAAFFAEIGAQYDALVGAGNFENQLNVIGSQNLAPVVLNFATGSVVGNEDQISSLDSDSIANNIVGSTVTIEATDGSGFVVTGTMAENPGSGLIYAVNINNNPGITPIQPYSRIDGSFVFANIIGLPVGDYTVTKQVDVACGDGQTSYFVVEPLTITQDDTNAFAGGGSGGIS